MKNILEIASILIASTAIVISYLIYLRQRTFENENHLYKYKFEKCYEILTQISNMYIFIEQKTDEFYDEVDFHKAGEEVLDKIRDEFYKQTDFFEFEIYSKVALLPKKVISAIEMFIDKFNDLDILPIDKIDSYDITSGKIDDLVAKIDLIEKAMREDLCLETIDSNLSNRLQTKKRKRK